MPTCERKGKKTEEKREAGGGRKVRGYPLSPSLIHPCGPVPPRLGSHRLDDGVALHEKVQGLGSTAHNGRGQAVGEEVGPRALP